MKNCTITFKYLASGNNNGLRIESNLQEQLASNFPVPDWERESIVFSNLLMCSSGQSESEESSSVRLMTGVEAGVEAGVQDGVEVGVEAAVKGVDITEVYSPARITATCTRMMLVPGMAMDLQTGWDFTVASHRAEAIRRIKEEAPLLLIGSPPAPYCRLDSPPLRLCTALKENQRRQVRKVDSVARLYKRTYSVARFLSL